MKEVRKGIHFECKIDRQVLFTVIFVTTTPHCIVVSISFHIQMSIDSSPGW
jgi:hypothetical protein